MIRLLFYIDGRVRINQCMRAQDYNILETRQRIGQQLALIGRKSRYALVGILDEGPYAHVAMILARN